MSQPSTRPALYKGYRFPPEIISHCVWLYYRFGVSLRDVSELMLARGIEVSHEAIRLWTLRFGTEYARRLRRMRGACSNIWHLDELCLMINGERAWLWRADDDAGEVLDILVQTPPERPRREALLSQALEGTPDGAVRHRDRSAGELRGRESRRDADLPISAAGARTSVENSHQPVRQREGGLQRFKSLRHAARFCSVFSTGLQPVSARPPWALGTQLSHGDAPTLAGMGRRLGDDGVRCRSVRSRPKRPSGVVTSLLNVCRRTARTT